MRRSFFIFLLLSVVLFSATGCSKAVENSSKSAADTSAENMSVSNTPEKQVAAPSVKGKKILVAYFSRTGENYAVGNISKGNTHIVADMIAEMTGADTFEIKPINPYPENYKECTDIAKKELADNARPTLATKVENMKDYDVIFLGYPIWWSDMPMAIYSFMESYDFQGKTVIPFATSAGDVLTGKENTIPQYAKGAKVLQGLGIEGKRAQKSPDSVRPDVQKWLMQLGFIK